jgi:hypothetical protein
MTQYALAAVANFTQFFDNQGKPLSGGKIFTYAAGSYSVEQPTYSDNSGTTNTNPIVLDSSGRPSTAIWLDAALAYRFVLTRGDGTTVVSDIDDVTNVVVNSDYSAGTGISIDNNIITNTGVVELIAGEGITLSANSGVITIDSTGGGGNIPGGNVGQIPFQSAPGTTTFSAALVWNNASNSIELGTGGANVYLKSSIGTNLNLEAGNFNGSSNQNGSVNIRAGSGGATTAGGVNIFGGTSQSSGGGINLVAGAPTTFGNGGSVLLQGSEGKSSGYAGGYIYIRGGASAPAGTAGNISLIGGQGQNGGTGGEIVFYTSVTGDPELAEKFRIKNTGAFSFSGFSNTGSSGQVLISQGSGLPPGWSNTVSNLGLTGLLTLSAETIAAAGTNRLTATQISATTSTVTTASSGQGVRLPTADAGLIVILKNSASIDVLVWPPTDFVRIDSLTPGTSYTLPVGARVMFVAMNNTWTTLGLTL